MCALTTPQAETAPVAIDLDADVQRGERQVATIPAFHPLELKARVVGGLSVAGVVTAVRRRQRGARS